MALEKYFLAAWQSVSGIGSVQISGLLQTFGSAAAAWRESAAGLRSAGVLSAEALQGVLRLREEHPALAEEK